MGKAAIASAKRTKKLEEKEEARIRAEKEATLAIDLARLKRFAQTTAGKLLAIGLIGIYISLLSRSFASIWQAASFVLAWWAASGRLGPTHVVFSVALLWWMQSKGASERTSFNGGIRCMGTGILLHLCSVGVFGIVRLALIELGYGTLDRSNCRTRGTVLRPAAPAPRGDKESKAEKKLVARADMMAARAISEFTSVELQHLRDHDVSPWSPEARPLLEQIKANR